MTIRRDRDDGESPSPVDNCVEVCLDAEMPVMAGCGDVVDAVVQINLLGDVARGDTISQIAYSLENVDTWKQVSIGWIGLVGWITLPLCQGFPAVQQLDSIFLDKWNSLETFVRKTRRQSHTGVCVR